MAKKRAEPDKSDKGSGQITLRVGEELKQELIGLGKELGLDLNGLIGLMIRRSMGHFRLEAHILAGEAASSLRHLAHWQSHNPGRPAREFLDDYAREQRREWLQQQVQFWEDIRFTVDEAYAPTRFFAFASVSEEAKPAQREKEPS